MAATAFYEIIITYSGEAGGSYKTVKLLSNLQAN